MADQKLDVATAGEAHDVDQARRELEATRNRISHDLSDIETRLRAVKGDIRHRLDLLEPARRRIRADVWPSLAVAFGAGLTYAVLTARRADGRRGIAGQVLRSAVAQAPGAVLSGVAAGLRDRARREWNERRPAA